MKIIDAFRHVAREEKSWAESRDNEYLKKCSPMSRDHIAKMRTQPVERIANDLMNYVKHRATLTVSRYPGDTPHFTDPHFREIWLATEAGCPAPLFRHFGITEGPVTA